MTGLPNPATGDTVAATHITDIKSTLEGGAGYTTPFKLQQSSGDFLIQMADHAGANGVRFNDSLGVQMFRVDSLGNVTFVGTPIFTALVLPLSASPAQTAAGSASYDTVRNVLTIGTGAATKSVGLTRGAGNSATATNELVYDTTAATLKVWDGSTSQQVGTDTNFTNTRLAFRANRRLVAEWTAQDSAAIAGTLPVATGLGFAISGAASSAGSLTNISGEPTLPMSQAIGASALTSLSGGGIATVLSPAHSPRMLVRFAPPAGSANVTDFLVGFFSANSATPNGAYIRITTTGHLFFVTRQGGSETTFDMGAQVAGVVVGYEIESVDAGVTWVLRNQAGTQLASQATNVPTAATALAYGLAATEATGAISWSAAYCRVEGTFA